MKRKIILFLMTLIIAAFCAGCEQNKAGKDEEKTQTDEKEQQICMESEKLAEGYREIYDGGVESGSLESLEIQKKIIDFIGNSGYAASDWDDQIDMVNYEQVENFCKSAGEGKEDSVILISLLDEGGFVRYDMETKGGEINVTVSTLVWEEDRPRVCYYHEFTAFSWKYTEKGYFFVEEYHPPGYDGPPGELAFRIKPLDPFCRELNRKYVSPIGYARNNLLITDWNEQDYSELDFYDLYEKLYYISNGSSVPYKACEGAEYEIPEEEFETVIQSSFRIGKEKIRENTVYDPNGKTYRYRPRGLHDAEPPYEPYPEVTAYEEQEDGTLRLFVEAVWERKMTDHAVVSELTVRPLENGGFQYVSNQVTGWDETLDMMWYFPRLSDEEWQYYYKNLQQE